MTKRFRIRASLTILVSVLGLQPVRSLSRAQDKPVERIILAAGTPLTVVTIEEINSKTVNPVDVLVFKVGSDVVVDSHVVISKGTLARGSVINAEASGSMGRSGKLGIAVESTRTIDGQPLRLRAARGEEGRDKTDSTVALILLSPAFMLRKGSDAKIPAGTQITVYVAEEKRFRVVAGKLVADNPSLPTDAPAMARATRPVNVYIYRPNKFNENGKEPSVFCDGVPLARVENGRYFVLRLAPGKHTVHMTELKKGFAIDMGPGQTYYFRVGIEENMWKAEGKLTLEDAAKALPEIKKIFYIGKDKIKDHTMVLDSDPGTATPEQ
jgi:Protein of unknown function (DUF2846)